MSKGKFSTPEEYNKPNSGEFPIVSEGLHKVEIMDYSDKETKNGDPMVNIQMEVVDGKDEGRYLWDNIIFPLKDSPAIKISGRSRHFLHCIGEPYEGDIEWDSDKWIGRRCYVEVFHEEYQGKMQTKIKTYNGLSHKELAEENKKIESWDTTEESPL